MLVVSCFLWLSEHEFLVCVKRLSCLHLLYSENRYLPSRFMTSLSKSMQRSTSWKYSDHCKYRCYVYGMSHTGQEGLLSKCLYKRHYSNVKTNFTNFLTLHQVALSHYIHAIVQTSLPVLLVPLLTKTCLWNQVQRLLP